MSEKVFDNIEVQDPTGKLIAYTSKKRAKDKIRDGLAEELKAGQAIKLNYFPKMENGMDSLNLRKNQCEICGGKKDLTRHHVYPRWHPMICKIHSENLRCLCETDHKSVEEYYSWKLNPPTKYDKYLREVIKMLSQLRKLIIQTEGTGDKDYAIKIRKDLLKKKDNLLKKQRKDQDEIIAAYNFEEVYKEALVYVKLKNRR